MAPTKSSNCKFRIYYDGEETYTGDPFLAPVWGVLVIVEPDPEMGRRIVSAGEFYGWTGSRWIPLDHVGLYDYLAIPGPRRVLIGRLVENEVYRKAVQLALDDQDFPIKTSDGKLNGRIDGKVR